jgi:hypothetical protein
MYSVVLAALVLALPIPAHAVSHDVDASRPRIEYGLPSPTLSGLVTGDFLVERVIVTPSLHPRDSRDLVAFLASPSGVDPFVPTPGLLEGVGSPAARYHVAVPLPDLGALAGESRAGRWTFTVVDRPVTDGGSIKGFGLNSLDRIHATHAPTLLALLGVGMVIAGWVLAGKTRRR